MTPDQIHPDHTYATTGGQQYRVLSITAGLVEAHPAGYPVDCSMRAGLSVFASLCVRDITPAPESDRGEKVAQAQSQGASRGDGCGLVRKFAIDVAEYLYIAGHRDDGPPSSAGTRLLRQAREIVQHADGPPAADAVKGELLDSLKNLVELVRSVEPGVSERIDRARAAIARAEAVQ